MNEEITKKRREGKKKANREELERERGINTGIKIFTAVT